MVLQYNSPSSIFAYEDSWLIGDIIKQLGGHLLFGKMHIISKEEMIMLNPDVILVLCTGAEDKDKYVNFVKNELVFNNINAVKKKRVYGIPFSFVYSPGVNISNGLRTVFECLYPNLKNKIKRSSLSNSGVTL